MKRLLSVFTLLFVLLPVFGEVKIDKKDRVKNRSPGYCAWACIETLGRHHGVEKLKDLVEKRSHESDVKIWDSEKKIWIPQPRVIVMDGRGFNHEVSRNGGWSWAVYRKLKSLGVKFYMTNAERSKLIDWAIDKNLGCVFIVKPGWDDGEPDEGEPPHALILTDMNDDKVKFLDPNDISKVFTETKSWFEKYSYDYVLVIPKQ